MKKIKFLSIIMAFMFLFSLSACLNNVDNEEKTYNIGNTYFLETTYEKCRYTNANLQNGTTTYQYGLNITSLCAVSLYEYTAEVKLFSSSKELLETQTISKKKDIEANEEFCFDIKISKETQLATDSIEAIFSGKSHKKPGDIQVTFVYNNGQKNSKVFVEKGSTIFTPRDPQKKNCVFSGWYTDGSLYDKYDFSKPITKELTLYAKYDVDAVEITNIISTDLIKGVVKIYNKSYNTFLGIETSSATSQGSGFCFTVSNGYYYVLTNCHVAKKSSSHDKQKITIEDYQGKTYEAYLYKNPNKSSSAIDAAYDLACLYFVSSSTNVKSLSLADKNPSEKEDVVNIGAPDGQSNSITYGKIVDYCKVTLSSTSTALSNVKFDVIEHNANTDGGSSGGPVLDVNLNVVGVHYAGSRTINRGYAIPVEKVKEFLNKYVYN